MYLPQHSLHSLLKWNAVLTSQAHLSCFWSLWKQNYTAYIFVGMFGFFSSELSVTVYVWKIHLFGCVRQQLFHRKCCLISYCLASVMSTVSERLDCFQCWTAIRMLPWIVRCVSWCAAWAPMLVGHMPMNGIAEALGMHTPTLSEYCHILKEVEPIYIFIISTVSL